MAAISSGDIWWADAQGNVSLSSDLTGLLKNSVVNVSQIVTMDKRILTGRIGKLPVNKTHSIGN